MSKQRGRSSCPVVNLSYILPLPNTLYLDLTYQTLTLISASSNRNRTSNLNLTLLLTDPFIRFDALMELLAELDEADNKAEFVEYDEAEEGAGSVEKASIATASLDSLPKDLLDSPNIRAARKSLEKAAEEGQSNRSANSAGKGSD